MVMGMHVVAEVKKWGNSLGLIIPKETTEKLKLVEGKKVDIDIVPRERVDAFGICKGAKPFKREREEHEF